MRRVLAAALLVGLTILPGRAATFRARARDFRCLLDGVRPAGKNFFLFHRSKKKLAQAVAIAENPTPGQEYPVGTIIQLFPFEAMAKHGGHYNPEGHGWEFFQIGLTAKNRSMILTHGKAEVRNPFGSCQGCHLTGQAPAFDLICEGHGAFSIPLSTAQVRAAQLRDPRCQPAH